MLTATRRAYVQVRCAVVALWSERNQLCASQTRPGKSDLTRDSGFASCSFLARGRTRSAQLLAPTTIAPVVLAAAEYTAHPRCDPSMGCRAPVVVNVRVTECVVGQGVSPTGLAAAILSDRRHRRVRGRCPREALVMSRL